MTDQTHVSMLAIGDAAKAFCALYEPLFAEMPRLQLERRKFGIEAGKQPIREALL